MDAPVVAEDDTPDTSSVDYTDDEDEEDAFESVKPVKKSKPDVHTYKIPTKPDFVSATFGSNKSATVTSPKKKKSRK